MASFPASQVSFAGGEVSPRLAGRVDSDLYRKALSRCENFEPMPQGSIRMRYGTELSRDLSADGLTAGSFRLLPMRVSSGQNFLVALGTRTMRIYGVDGSVATAQYFATSDQLTNGDFSGGSAGWTTVSGGGSTSVTFSAGKAVFFKGAADFLAVGIYQSITLAAASDIRITVDAADWLSANSSIRVMVGNVVGGSTVLNWSGRPEGPASFDLTALASGTYYFQIEAPTGRDFANNRGFSLDSVTFAVASTAYSTAIETPWASDQVNGIQIVMETGVDRITLVHEHVRPQQLKYLGVGGWSFSEVAFSGQPTEWSGAAWPGVCELYQGRLWLGGVPGYRSRLWASRVGSVYDFNLETDVSGTMTVLPTDGIDVEVATQGAIRWMRAGRSLLFGTDLGEHSVTAQGGFIAPGDIQVRDESAFGATSIQAVTAGEIALYVSSDRRKVRGLRYDLQSSGWNSRDITFPAEHLTSPLIAELHHARDPNGTIFLILDGGTAVACTFNEAEQVAAWWRITLPSATIKSACVARTEDGDSLWLITKRDGLTYLEQMPIHEAGLGYLDAATTGTVPVGGVITGLGHLHGRTVKVVVDGAVLDDQVVSTTTATVDAALAGQTYIAGLGFTATARTLPLADPTQTSKRRLTKVRVRLNDSAIPLLNGQRAPERLPVDPMNTGTDPTTGDVDYQMLGWDDGVLTITQDVPLRTEVLAIFSAAKASEV